MTRPAGGKQRYQLRSDWYEFMPSFWCELSLPGGTWHDDGWRHFSSAEAIRRAPR